MDLDLTSDLRYLDVIDARDCLDCMSMAMYDLRRARVLLASALALDDRLYSDAR